MWIELMEKLVFLFKGHRYCSAQILKYNLTPYTDFDFVLVKLLSYKKSSAADAHF